MAVIRFQKTLLRFTLTIVFALGLVVAITMAGSPEEARNLGFRQPANLDPGYKAVEVKPEVGVVEVDCVRDSYEVPRVSQVQIRGFGCQLNPDDKVLETLIRNETNGFTATVFPSEQTKFLTDYIQVFEGTNHILVRQKLLSGEIRERRISITR